MMRISSQQIYRQGLTSLQKNQETVSRANLELSSGYSVITAGDDPAAATQASRISSKLAQSGQYQRNNTSLNNSLSYEESVLGSVETSMLRVQSLVTEAGNGALSDSDREAIAKELEDRMTELQDLMNSKDSSGNYIFSGHATKTEPFTADATSTTGYTTYSYQGDSGKTNIDISSYVSLAKNDPGDSVFTFDEVDADGNSTGNSTNILNVVSETIDALRNSSGDSVDLSKYLNNIDTAYNTVLGTVSGIGARQNVADNVQATLEANDVSDTSQRASLVEADYYEAVTNLTQSTSALQIAQASYVKIQGMSLFDYL
ncbi:flagellar hook-associated protein FlgL [Pokkaliibacter sp. MBI-7]|uniref:flagellar hook-associated protein FlgL n=1 Tax=Pokkaliibacter sp. MBI-7 TaxID=3040600 RepID=UPI00244D22A2|nr:flagellar hook-associated protein FlgL [Pokkaliibacter sp. MBI-7]MDH2431315.1 flagellar hook-associated protein FlgL [Pokkaliibacter sp. MBI-7]